MATVLDVSHLTLCVERWIAEARGGSRVALNRLLEAGSSYLIALAKRELCAALRPRLDPVDVVQNTLMKAWRNFHQFRGATEAEWCAWLRQILRHNLANERREHIRTAMRSVHNEVSLAAAAAISSERHVQALETHEALEMALRRLPEHYRQVLNLHAQEDMTFAQVGDRLRCSTEAARKIWKRAVRKLGCFLEDTWRSKANV
jgi:RNA polymerase sigma-70 factor, ECF subfamily